MSSYINFKNFGDTSRQEVRGAKPAGNVSLARQSSVYSLTFDELQSTLVGVGKDFGSMNMDELLKNIWTAEVTQPMASASGLGEGIAVPSGNLQKQGSLTLPRTLSQKTVDEVWRDLLKESDNLKDGSGSGNGGAILPLRQATLGEVTLEEFLLRAGVVGEATHPIGRPNNDGFYGDLSQQSNNATGLSFGFQQPARNHESLNNQIVENNTTVPILSSGLALNAHGVISQQQFQQQHQKQQQHQQHHQPPLFPKQATVAFSSPVNLVNHGQLGSPGTRGPGVGRVDPINTSQVQSHVIQSGPMGLATLAPRVTAIAAGSPKTHLISNVIPKNDSDTSSVSPTPYAFNDGARGRKTGGTLEKVVERRRRRMIKNRESAARSRARKQAYTLELETEVAKLKEVIEDLQKKQLQEKSKELQKDQVQDKMKFPRGSKKLCLRRTRTGPW